MSPGELLLLENGCTKRCLEEERKRSVVVVCLITDHIGAIYAHIYPIFWSKKSSFAVSMIHDTFVSHTTNWYCCRWRTTQVHLPSLLTGFHLVAVF